jgi:hypothetical protein
MGTNELDRLIVKNVGRISYEYDADDWEALSAQLAAARRKKRVMAFTYISSGIAASVAIFLIGIVPMLSEKKTPAVSYTSGLYIPPATPFAESSVSPQVPGAPAIGQRNPATALLASPQHAGPLSDTLIYSVPNAVNNNLAANISTPPVNKTIDTSGFEQKHQGHTYQSLEPLQYAATENKPDHKGINISVAGGVSYGTVNTGYVLGAVADRKLGNKFGLELTVAYVGNAAATDNSTYPSYPGSNVYIPPVKPASVVTSPLNYLQLTPMLDYSLSKKITLSAGADVQRLLQDHNVTVFYNDNARVAPLIDLGMLLRVEYAVLPRLKAGVSYRLGTNNILSPGNHYLDRNYMQLQFRYKLH